LFYSLLLTWVYENGFANFYQELSGGKLKIRLVVVQCHYASVWRELVAFRVGDTSSRQTEAGATVFPQCRSGRAGGK
jgi:hypothetical protein